MSGAGHLPLLLVLFQVQEALQECALLLYRIVAGVLRADHLRAGLRVLINFGDGRLVLVCRKLRCDHSRLLGIEIRVFSDLLRGLGAHCDVLRGKACFSVYVPI